MKSIEPEQNCQMTSCLNVIVKQYKIILNVLLKGTCKNANIWKYNCDQQISRKRLLIYLYSCFEKK